MTTVDEPRPRRVRPAPRFVEVKRIERVSPHLTRITLSGDELDGFSPPGPAQHVKVFFPSPGQDRPNMPIPGPDGPEYTDAHPRPVSRTYTPRRWNAGTRELEIEIVLHGDGLGSRWAERAKVGDVLGISGPGGRYKLPTEADWYVLAADDAALPAMATILEALPPAVRVYAVAKVEDPSDERTFQTDAQLELTWLHGPSHAASEAIVQALRQAPLPSDGVGHAWVGCEASVMRAVRTHLLEERGMARTAVHTQGYWKAGDQNHPDHDYGDEA